MRGVGFALCPWAGLRSYFSRERRAGSVSTEIAEPSEMNTVLTPSLGSTARPTSIRTVALASLIGTTIEWYDFYLYGTAAALVFSRLYFPTIDQRLGTLAAFATYSVGFIARPVGGVVIGHFGDRVGRKAMLVFTMMVMGSATFAIGLLPTYEQWGFIAVSY